MQYTLPNLYIDIQDGHPVIFGRSLKVMYVANLHNNGASIAEIMEQYGLSEAQVYAALSYYYDHKDALDRELDEGEVRAYDLSVDARSHLAELRERNKSKGSSGE